MIHHASRIAVTIALFVVSVHEMRAETPRPRIFKVRDVITVTMKEAAETNAKRQRNGQYEAQLVQFTRINAEGNLNNAAQKSPEIDAELQSRLQSAGRVTESESTNYRIAATVVEILPNGVLVLDAHKSGVSNTDLWEYSLTGKVDPKKVSPDGSVLSVNIADLCIAKRQHHLYDWTGPF
jgi:flagellar L-ring protein precursor FlgH